MSEAENDFWSRLKASFGGAFVLGGVLIALLVGMGVIVFAIQALHIGPQVMAIFRFPGWIVVAVGGALGAYLLARNGPSQPARLAAGLGCLGLAITLVQVALAGSLVFGERAVAPVAMGCALLGFAGIIWIWRLGRGAPTPPPEAS